jgi:hypothetical protein
MLKFVKKLFKKNTIKITIIFENNGDAKFEKAFAVMLETINRLNEIYNDKLNENEKTIGNHN